MTSSPFPDGRGGVRRNISFDFLHSVGTDLLLDAMLNDGMPYHRSADVPGTVPSARALIPDDAVYRLDQRALSSHNVVAEVPGLLIAVETGRGVTELNVVGSDGERVEQCVADLVRRATDAIPEPDGSVRMRFWAASDSGGDMSSRRVETPLWSAVARNYPGPTAGQLDGLMTLTDMASRAGRLVLWHGAPGTGKTTAVRALSRAWEPWCEAHYVLDPEQLFSHPRYLLDVAGSSDGAEDDGKWRLVIAEDCDEYLRADARLRAGASLGRLLNLCDGILGHGLRVVLLLTTNEDVGQLHPAIVRPGRCLSRVEFSRFTRAEADAWLAGAARPTRDALTLAELYALLEQRPDTGDPEPPATGGYL